MRPLTAHQILNIWEVGRTQHPIDRALSLLAVSSGETRESLAKLPIGVRDSMLLDIYETVFSAALNAYAECPECNERLEFALQTTQLRGSSAEQLPSDAFIVNGTALTLRPLNSFDLAAIVNCSDTYAAKCRLLERCVEGVSIETLPQTAIDIISERLAKLDPQAEMSLELQCPACEYCWELAFDIEAFLWSKINVSAKRLFREVDKLARAYGWSEAEILGMSAARRQIYLELVD